MKVKTALCLTAAALFAFAAHGCSKGSNPNSSLDGDLADLTETEEASSVDYEWNPEWENVLEESASETPQEERAEDELDDPADDDEVTPDGGGDDSFEEDGYETDVKDKQADNEEKTVDNEADEEPAVETAEEKEPEPDAEAEFEEEIRKWKSCSICRDDQDCADLYGTDIYECYNYYCAAKNCVDDEECQAKSGYPSFSECLERSGRRVCSLCRSDADCENLYGQGYSCNDYYCRVKDCESDEECAAKQGYPSYSRCVDYYGQKVCSFCRNDGDCAEIYNTNIFTCYDYFCREKECGSDEECRNKPGYPAYSRCVEM